MEACYEIVIAHAVVPRSHAVACDRIESAAAVASDLQFGEFGFEVSCCDAVKLQVLLPGALPAGIRLRIGAVLGLIPYLPMRYVHLESVRPAIIVMHYDMLAYPRPFCEVCGRKDPVGLYMLGILNGHSEPVIRFHSIVHQSLDQEVRKGEII